jgi:putative ATPase
MRNSDPDASVYWLARMVESGEEPLYIARRLVRFASEDVGNADPQALAIAGGGRRTPSTSWACPRATPRWRRRRSTGDRAEEQRRLLAYNERRKRRQRDRRAGAAAPAQRADRLMKSLDYGKGYRYAHDEAEGIAADMECLPPAHQGGRSIDRRSRRGTEIRPLARCGAKQARSEAPGSNQA